MIATDQHDDYIKSAKEFCPKATHVIDRFHVMQNSERALDESRKHLRKLFAKSSSDKIWDLTRDKYRFIFLKKAARRTGEEKKHIEKVCRKNRIFMEMELIKERMLIFFDARTIEEAEGLFCEIRDWIMSLGVPPLKNWIKPLQRQWPSLANYFRYEI